MQEYWNYNSDNASLLITQRNHHTTLLLQAHFLAQFFFCWQPIYRIRRTLQLSASCTFVFSAYEKIVSLKNKKFEILQKCKTTLCSCLIYYR